MPYEVEFSGEERTFDPISPGQYEAFVNSIVEKEGGNGPYLNVRFVIADGQFKGRSLFTNCAFGKEAVWKLQNLLIATGLQNPGTKGKIKFSNEQLIGKRVGLKVVEETYNGEVRAAVKNIYSLTAQTATPGQAAPATAPATPTPAPPAQAQGVKKL